MSVRGNRRGQQRYPETEESGFLGDHADDAILRPAPKLRLRGRPWKARLAVLVLSLIMGGMLFCKKAHHPRGGGKGDSSLSSVLILKLPRSGSTWLTELLNGHHDVFMSKEIIQRSDVPDLLAAAMDSSRGPREVEAFLKQALSLPTTKYRLRHKLFPGGRFFEDYIAAGKALRSSPVPVVGATLNPEHLYGSNVNWTNVFGRASSTGAEEEVDDLPFQTQGQWRSKDVLLLERSNVVKHAVSKYRGDLLHRAGCSNNLVHQPSVWTRIWGGGSSSHSSLSQEECRSLAMSSPIRWNLDDFATAVNRMYHRIIYLRATAEQIRAAAPHVRVSTVYYESLQLDALDTLRGLVANLQLPMSLEVEEATEADGEAKAVARVTRARSAKRTAEDLGSSGVFDATALQAIARALLIDEKCICLHRQLVSSSPELFLGSSCRPQTVSVRYDDGGNGYFVCEGRDG